MTAGDISSRIRELRERQAKLQNRQIELVSLMSDRKMELADLGTVTAYVQDLHNTIKESTLIEKKALLHSFIKEIKVTGTEILITYTLFIS